jgi:hypothetical protein
LTIHGLILLQTLDTSLQRAARARESIDEVGMLITEQNSRVLYCGIRLRQIVIAAIIPLTMPDSDSRGIVASAWHYLSVTKSVISPVGLNQPMAGRNQEIGNVLIVILL